MQKKYQKLSSIRGISRVILLSLFSLPEEASLLHVLILDSGVMKYLASKFRTTATKSTNRKEYAMVHTYLTCQYGAVLSSDAVLFSEKCKHTVLKFFP
jgi:hypothetical protein